MHDFILQAVAAAFFLVMELMLFCRTILRVVEGVENQGLSIRATKLHPEIIDPRASSGKWRIEQGLGNRLRFIGLDLLGIEMRGESVRSSYWTLPLNINSVSIGVAVNMKTLYN